MFHHLHPFLTHTHPLVSLDHDFLTQVLNFFTPLQALHSINVEYHTQSLELLLQVQHQRSQQKDHQHYNLQNRHHLVRHHYHHTLPHDITITKLCLMFTVIFLNIRLNL